MKAAETLRELLPRKHDGAMGTTTADDSAEHVFGAGVASKTREMRTKIAKAMAEFPDLAGDRYVARCDRSTLWKNHKNEATGTLAEVYRLGQQTAQDTIAAKLPLNLSEVVLGGRWKFEAGCWRLELAR